MLEKGFSFLSNKDSSLHKTSCPYKHGIKKVSSLKLNVNIKIMTNLSTSGKQKVAASIVGMKKRNLTLFFV